MFRIGVGRLAGVSVLATLAISLILPSAPAHADGSSSGHRITARWKSAVNTQSRDAVNNAYWARYQPKQLLPISWLGGSLGACLPGLSSSSTNKATLSALNFVRSMAGLAPVSFSSTLNQRAQKAALIMAANNTLDHHPSPSWKCWSSTGADAASKSNLVIAWPKLRSGQIIDLYMDDHGDNNKAVGHRRWLLNPFSTVMGSGSTETTNALTVIGPTSANRPNPRWVSWPTAGWFPSTMEPNHRWSLSAGRKDIRFNKARVRVLRNGKRVHAHTYRVHNGYAQPTLVFQLGKRVRTSGNFKVIVSNIKRSGSRKSFRHKYRVKFFAPYQ